MIALFCAWACLFGAYLLFAGQTSTHELAAGAVCAVAGVLWWFATRRASPHAFTFGAGCWAAAGRAVRKLPSATLGVGAALLGALMRPQAGSVEHWFYAPGRLADRGDAGRRAIGVLAASLAPDSFVLRTPAERDEVVVHVFPSAEPPKDPRWLI